MKTSNTTKAKKTGEILPGLFIGEIKAVYSTQAKPIGTIKCSADAAKIFREIWQEGEIEYRESFYALFLSKSNNVIAWRCLFAGGLSGVLTDTKIIFQHAMLANAACIIIAHNHPSNTLKPSQADLQMTKKVKDGAALLEMPLLDHIIIAAEGYYSFADEGIL